MVGQPWQRICVSRCWNRRLYEEVDWISVSLSSQFDTGHKQTHTLN